MKKSSKYSDVIVRIACHYWGEPNKRLSRANILRFGSHGSKSVNVEKATWYDHEENIGGGVVDLIKHQEPGVSASDRLAEFGLPKESPNSDKKTIWSYTNTDEEIIYQVVRIDDAGEKKYFQQKLTSDGNLIKNMVGVTPVPYRLPELIQSTETVFIVEGEKCADALAGLGLTATTNHGGAGKWWPSLNEFFEGRDVVIIPDNDEPGRNHAVKVAQCLNGTAHAIKILPLPNLRPKGDIYDWIAQGGTKVELLDLVAATDFYKSELTTATIDVVHEPQHNEIEDLPVFGFNQLEEKTVSWLVDNLIPMKSFIALYGRPGSFKSFVALYLATMIGAGKQAFDRSCTSGDVVYVICEGSAGFKLRVDALKKKYDVLDADVYFIPAQINLRSTDQDRKKLISTIKSRGIDPVLVVIDTLARAFAGGNENTSEDMGAFIRQISYIQEELSASVMIVHHSGKDETRGQRGHSSLLGAVDTELEISRISKSKSDRSGVLTVTKQKDGQDNITAGFQMDVVSVGLIDTNKSSLVVVPAQADDLQNKPEKKSLAGQTKLAFEALHKAIDQDGKKVTNTQIPEDILCVEEKYWQHMFYAMRPGELQTKRKAFDRAATTLQENQWIRIWDSLVWISKS